MEEAAKSKVIQGIMYIYEIKNTVNGKRYIGQSGRNDNRRLNTHRYRLKRGTHINKHLLGAWKQYGEDVFEWNKIRENIETVEKLNELEDYYIELYNTTDPRFGYNMAKHSEAPMRGATHSAKTKKLMSESRSGRSKNKEWKKKIRKANKETWSEMMCDDGFSKMHKLRSFRNCSTQEEANELAKSMRIYHYPDKVVSPEGKIYEIGTIKGFCKEHNLDDSTFRKMLRGKYKQYKGWRIK